LNAVKGMFVRAEGMRDVGGKSRQLKKDEVLGEDCRIIRIMTNRNRAHEGDAGGGGGGGATKKKVHRTKS
jgi:hypothetical protein